MARIKVFDTKSQSWVYADKSFGKDGTTPVKGVDYFTDADKEEFLNDIDAVRYVEQALTEEQKAQARANIGIASTYEIVQAVIESLGGNPIFGIVDENNNIIISGKLADRTYSVKYEMEDGSLINIGNLVLYE